MGSVTLREVRESDLPVFFDDQRDAVANRMAAFPPRERDAFFAHWRKIMDDPSCVLRTVVLDGQVAGNIVSWEQDGRLEVGYWIGRSYWGRGIATAALTDFLSVVAGRPLFAHVAKHNLGSQRVLQKCGFRLVREAEAELIFILDSPVRTF